MGPWLKNLLKIGPKTVFFRQKTPFLAKKIQAACRDGGEGVPPFAVIFFPLIFWPAACRDGGRGGGGYPHHGKKPWLGFLNPSLREAVKEELDFLFEILRPLPLNLDLDAPDFSAKEICVMTGSP